MALLARRVAALGAILGSVACSATDPVTPALEPRVVVHAVLDPQHAEQVVFVEETRISELVRSSSLDPRDLVSSAGGTPISGATVIVYGPGADSAVAEEDRMKRFDGTGAGVYRIRSVTVTSTSAPAAPNVLRLVPGTVYRLEVRTPLATVRGETRLPSFVPAPDRAARKFNLDADTLRLARAARLAGAAAFYLRLAMPGFTRDDRFERSIDDRLLIPAPTGDPGDWAFAPWRDAIIPGTIQTFSVVAVDSNYLKYNVIGADPFGDDVRGNTLRGGVGLFGSVATFTDVALELVADRNHPIEGDWIPLGVPGTSPVALRLFESPRFPHDDGAPGLAFTGTARFANGSVMFAEATMVGASVSLSLRSTAKGVVRQYTGTLDTSVLTLQGVGSSVRVRYGPK